MNHNDFTKEYPILSIISIILKIFGFVIVVVTVVIAVALLINRHSFFYGFGNERIFLLILAIFSVLLGGLLISLIPFAYAELIKIFVRIELNTRKDEIDEAYHRSIENDYRKQSTENNDNTSTSYENWKKENPGKSINDYYASNKK